MSTKLLKFLLSIIKLELKIGKSHKKNKIAEIFHYYIKYKLIQIEIQSIILYHEKFNDNCNKNNKYNKIKIL